MKQNDKDESENVQDKVADKVDEILNKLSLIEEDVKGIEVDEFK